MHRVTVGGISPGTREDEGRRSQHAQMPQRSELNFLMSLPILLLHACPTESEKERERVCVDAGREMSLVAENSGAPT